VRVFAEHVEVWTFFTFQYLLNRSLPVPQKTNVQDSSCQAPNCRHHGIHSLFAAP